MEAADILCKSLFHWLENRNKCGEELKKLAQELEDVPQGSNITQVLRALASMSAAAALTYVCPGLAKPLLLASTVASTAVSPTSTAIEAGVSSSNFKEATELIKEDEKVGANIQKLLRDLKDRCGEELKDRSGEELKDRSGEELKDRSGEELKDRSGEELKDRSGEELKDRSGEELKDRSGEDLKDRSGEALLEDHADELDCEVTTQLMWALARRRDTHVPLDFLRGFNRATFFRHMTPGGLDPAEASDYICKALGLDPSPEITSSLKVSAKEMMKNIELIGIKSVAKSGSEGVIGLGISMYDLIVKSEELIKGNRITGASKLLRDSAREILDGQQKLKEQLDAMNEIIQKLFRMKNLIEALGRYSLSMTINGQKIMDYIIGTCRDNTVLSWLKTFTPQTEFLNLLRFCQKRFSYIPEDFSMREKDHIHIVFVAHGGIVDQFMPAGGLVPTPNIRDTILYSPWNCAINSNAAFAIAEQFIHVTNTEFYTLAKDGHIAHYEPGPLPCRWNSMRRSLHDIPVILLSPVTPDEEPWKLFHQLWENCSMEMEDRVIIPYLVPEEEVDAFREIPLFMIIFATSYILSLCDKSATVHLAACLSLKERPEEWQTQYAYTSVKTVMSVKMDIKNMNSDLFRALSSLFDRETIDKSAEQHRVSPDM